MRPWTALLTVLVVGFSVSSFAAGSLRHESLPSPPILANSPPYVNYSWSPATGDVTTVFNFTAKLADAEDPVSALEVRWDWESDGTWDTAWTTNKTAQHVFPMEGTSWVLLEGRDTGGLTGNRSYGISVTAIPPPPPPPLEVTISASPTEGTMPLTVTFTSQVMGGVPPYGYHWTLGDGSMSPAANPVHIYLTSGDFPVWLDVYDSARADAQSNVIFVNVTGAAVNLTVSPPTAFVADADGIHASFSATVSGGTPPYAYLWDFGDGSQSTLANPDHAYAASGIYAVTLLVTDAKGLSVTYRLVLTVAASSEVAPSEDSLWPAIGTGIAIGAGATFLGTWWLQRRARRPKV